MENTEKLCAENLEHVKDAMLEDVAGGGIKEIVAGVTLAAMTMTGSPVSSVTVPPTCCWASAIGMPANSSVRQSRIFANLIWGAGCVINLSKIEKNR